MPDRKSSAYQLSQVEKVIFGPEGYSVRPLMEALKARWDAGARQWILALRDHPMATLRGYPYLADLIRAVRLAGVRIDYVYRD
jgi:hypothetical protein